MVGNDHHVVGEGPDQEFAVLGRLGPGGEGGAEPALVPGDAALGLGPVAVLPDRESVETKK